MSRSRTYAESAAASERRRGWLTAPSRDHAGQAAALAHAVANTTASAAPVGVLLWPGQWPVHAVLADLGVPARCFLIVSDRRSTWRHLYGRRRDTVLFDPHGLAGERSEFGARVREARFETVVSGLEACRAAIAKLVAGDAA
jgi:hypothetical protein